MKENKKGFTLIELLAVIVILAVIALIATPIILNIITSARESSQGRSVESFASAIIDASTELQYKSADVSGSFTVSPKTENGDDYQVCDKNNTSACAKVNYSGSRVKCTKLIIQEGYVALAGCKVGNSDTSFHYNNSSDTIDGVAATKGAAVKDETPAE